MSRVAFVLALAAFVVQAQAPSNDDCAGAIAVFDGINPGAPTGANGFTFSNVGGTESVGAASCLANNPGTSDVWFSYVATFTGPCVFQTCTPVGFANGSLGDTIIEVYDACGGARLACDDDACFIQGLGSSSWINVTSGTTYIVRVASWSTTNTTEGTFYLSVIPSDSTSGSAATAEDCGTTSAVLSANNGVALVNNQGALGSTPSGTCTTLLGTDLDLWWIYVPSASGTLLLSREAADPSATNVGPETGGLTKLAVYNGAGGCGSLNQICSTTASNLSTAVVGGNLYYIRTAGPTAGVGNFSWFLQLPPANDTCGSSFTVIDGVNPAVASYTNVAALDDAGYTAAACAASAIGSKGVFFNYTATTTGTTVVSTCTPADRTAGTLTDTIVEVFADCVSTTSIACNDNFCGTLSTVSFSSVAGTNYVIRVSSKSTTASGTFYLTVNPLPFNDECVAAAPVGLGANGPFNMLGATTSAGTVTCSTLAQDLWYSFTAPSTGTLRVHTCGSNFDAVLAAFDACGGVQLACDDDDLNNLGPCATTQTLNSYLEFPAVAGSTYYFRVGNFSTTTIGTLTLTLSYKFSLSITSNPGLLQLSLTDFAGTPGNLVINALTLNQGAYPNGWFYGVDIPIGELFTEFSSGPPFAVILDGSGGYSITYGGVPTLGITLYCVGVEFSPAGVFVQKSNPIIANI
jgi:hypothetical protein